MILDHILPSVGALSSVTIISHEEFELLICNRNKDTPLVIGYSIYEASRCMCLISIQQTRASWLPWFPVHSIVQIANWARLNKHKEYLWTSKWIIYSGHILWQNWVDYQWLVTSLMNQYRPDALFMNKWNDLDCTLYNDTVSQIVQVAGE